MGKLFNFKRKKDIPTSTSKTPPRLSRRIRCISRSSQFQSILRGTIYRKDGQHPVVSGPQNARHVPHFDSLVDLFPFNHRRPSPPSTSPDSSFPRLCESQQPAKAQSSSRAKHFRMGLHQGTMTFRKRRRRSFRQFFLSFPFFSFFFFFFFPPFGGQSVSARRNCSKRGPSPPPVVPFSRAGKRVLWAERSAEKRSSFRGSSWFKRAEIEHVQG